jgi:hypothetical protein
MTPDDLKKLLALGIGPAKEVVRGKLEEADQHPVGHFAFELVRAHLRGELDTKDDFLAVLREAIKPR